MCCSTKDETCCAGSLGGYDEVRVEVGLLRGCRVLTASSTSMREHVSIADLYDTYPEVPSFAPLAEETYRRGQYPVNGSGGAPPVPRYPGRARHHYRDTWTYPDGTTPRHSCAEVSGCSYLPREGEVLGHFKASVRRNTSTSTAVAPRTCGHAALLEARLRTPRHSGRGTLIMCDICVGA